MNEIKSVQLGCKNDDTTSLFCLFRNSVFSVRF